LEVVLWTHVGVSGSAGLTIETAKAMEKWVVQHPLQATAIETVAHELGVDPFQLASKIRHLLE